MTLEKTFQFDKIRHLALPMPLCVEQHENLSEVVEKMRQARASCVLVCDGARLVGIFTSRDVLYKVIDGSAKAQVAISEFMTSSPATLSAEASVAEAIKMMDGSRVRHLPLIDSKGEIAGMISADHIVNYLVEHFPTEVYNLPPRLQQKIATPEGA